MQALDKYCCGYVYLFILVTFFKTVIVSPYMSSQKKLWDVLN